MEEIFKVNFNEDIEGMDLCYLIQDTSKTPAPPQKNHRLHPPY